MKASRLSDAHGVMLVLPNRDVWTFKSLDDKVDLEDSVFLAGNDGPRRTTQIVIRAGFTAGPQHPLELCPLDGFRFGNDGPAQCAPRTGIAAVANSGLPPNFADGDFHIRTSPVSSLTKPCYPAGLPPRTPP